MTRGSISGAPPRNIFSNAASLGSAKKDRRTPVVELDADGDAPTRKSIEVRNPGFSKPQLRSAIKHSAIGRQLRRNQLKAQGSQNWLDSRIVQRAASRTNSLARVMSNSGSFMRTESMNSSFLDPGKTYTSHVRRAAVKREMSLSTLEFSRLWEKAAEQGWEDARRTDDDVMEIDVDEEKEQRRGKSFVRFQNTANTLGDGNESAAAPLKDGVKAVDDQVFEQPTTLHRRSYVLRHFLNPLSRTRKNWDMLLILLIAVDCLVFPVVTFVDCAAFWSFWDHGSSSGPSLHSENMQWHPWWTVLLVFSYFMDALFVLDFISMFHTVRLEHGRAIVFPHAIRMAYLESAAFWVDLFGVFPMELFGVFAGIPALMLMLRFPRVVCRSHRVAIKINTARMNIRSNTVAVMLAVICFYVFMGSHWIACSWYGLGMLAVGNGEETWTERYDLAYEYVPWTRCYVLSLYWTVATLTSVGYGDIVARTTAEHLFALVVMLCGHALYAYIFGLMATLISNQDFAAAQFRAKLAGIRQFMAYRLLPDNLCERIDTYYDHLWAETKGFNELRIIRELPSSVAQDLSLHMYENFIIKVPLFKKAEAGFIRSLVSKLQPEIYPAYEFVVRKGDVGKHMFFIQRGVCEVIEETTDVVLFLLEEGGYFGEIALLMAERRTASVRTGTVCDMLILARSDLEEVLESYPKMRRELVDQGKVRIRERREKEHQVSQIIIKRWQDAQTKKKIADELREEGEKTGVAGKAKLMVSWWKKKVRVGSNTTSPDTKHDPSTRSRRSSTDSSFKINGTEMSNLNERELRAFLQERENDTNDGIGMAVGSYDDDDEDEADSNEAPMLGAIIEDEDEDMEVTPESPARRLSYAHSAEPRRQSRLRVQVPVDSDSDDEEGDEDTNDDDQRNEEEKALEAFANPHLLSHQASVADMIMQGGDGKHDEITSDMTHNALKKLQKQNSKLIVELAKMKEENENLGDMVQAVHVDPENVRSELQRQDSRRLSLERRGSRRGSLQRRDSQRSSREFTKDENGGLVRRNSVRRQNSGFVMPGVTRKSSLQRQGSLTNPNGPLLRQGSRSGGRSPLGGSSPRSLSSGGSNSPERSSFKQRKLTRKVSGRASDPSSAFEDDVLPKTLTSSLTKSDATASGGAIVARKRRGSTTSSQLAATELGSK